MSNPTGKAGAVMDDKKTVYIRLDKETVDRIEKIAKKEERSFSFIAARILDAGSKA